MICKTCGKEFFEDYRKWKEGIPNYCSLGCARTKATTEETKKKISNSMKKAFKEGRAFGNPKTYEGLLKKKEKISNSMKAKYLEGFEVKCGRCKKIEYITKNNEKIKVDGSWELAVAKYLDTLDVTWKRNKKRFSYINLNNKISTYCPDFWIEDWKTYLEVKGYETELDKCKWSQFKEPLLIWKREKLKELDLI